MLLFVAVFMVVLRPTRAYVNTQIVYPVMERVVAADEDPFFYIDLRSGKSYFEVYPLEVQVGWKTKYDFRLEGGLFYLIAGVALLLFGAHLSYFAWLTLAQLALGLISLVFMYGGLAWWSPLLTGSNLIMVYISPAVCVMLMIIPLKGIGPSRRIPE